VNGAVSVIKTDENGGVKNDSDFTENFFAKKMLIPINLIDARTRRGNREFTAVQFLNFGKIDTANKDSTVRHKIIPRSCLSYSLHAGDEWFAYDDKHPLTGFYENAYFDTVRTLDSTHIFTLQHAVSVKSYFTKNIFGEISFEQKTIHVAQYAADSLKASDIFFTDNILHWGIGKQKNKNEKGLGWKLSGENIINGNHKGDYFVTGSLFYQFRKEKKITFSYENTLHAVPFLYSMHASNNFFWINSFSKENVVRSTLSYIDVKNKFCVSASATSIYGYVYLDTNSLPSNKINTNYISVYLVSIHKNFKIGKFHLNNDFTWQTNYTGIINLPKFLSKNSLFYEDNWFGQVTHVQLGFDVNYFSSYYADAYMPALGLFYLQNKMQIGNYPYLDFFFNMKVKHARFFFKTEHVNSGLMGAYYLAPHFPAPDRAIKVGISWAFYD
jgi:hypothetical protein